MSLLLVVLRKVFELAVCVFSKFFLNTFAFFTYSSILFHCAIITNVMVPAGFTLVTTLMTFLAHLLTLMGLSLLVLDNRITLHWKKTQGSLLEFKSFTNAQLQHSL